MQVALIGATAPATGAGLGKFETVEDVGDAAALALGAGDGVGRAAVLLLPHATNITAAAIAREPRNRMRGAILLLSSRTTT